MEAIKEAPQNQQGSMSLLQLVLSKLNFLQDEHSIQNESYSASDAQTYYFDFNSNESETVKSVNGTYSTMPPDFTQISQLNQRCVIVYTVLFFFAAIGNLLVLYSVFSRKKVRKTRISILIINLCVADLIVTFFLMPTEVFWRLTIAWKGGEFLCKVSQFVRAFGLYLSSNVVICISIDRYYSIVHPLKLGGAVRRVKFTLVGAWIVATVFAGPQMFVYHVAQHPEYPEFRQCVTKAFLKQEPYNELIYNVSSVSALYFIPLLVVIYTYTMILWKLYRKSKEQRVPNGAQETSLPPISSDAPFLPPNIGIFYRKLSISSARNDSTRTRIVLRCSENHRITIIRARSRTLKLTLLILLTFIVCWTPYVTITLWYMLDRTGASQVDERLQEALFIMTVANSVINPFIYGTVGRKQRCRRKLSASCFSFTIPKFNLMCCHLNGVTLLKRDGDLTIKNNENQLGEHCKFQVYEHASEGHLVGTVRKKKTNFDTVLGFSPGIKRGKLGWRNSSLIINDRVTI